MDVRATLTGQRDLWRSLWVGLAAVGFGSALMMGVACEKEGPAEQAGEAVDETADEVGDAVDDATE